MVQNKFPHFQLHTYNVFDEFIVFGISYFSDIKEKHRELCEVDGIGESCWNHKSSPREESTEAALVAEMWREDNPAEETAPGDRREGRIMGGMPRIKYIIHASHRSGAKECRQPQCYIHIPTDFQL